MGSPWISWSLPAAVTTGNTPACLHADLMAELQKLLLLWCWHLEGCTCSCVSHPCLPPSPRSGLGPLARAGTLPSLWLGHLCGHPGVLGRQMSQAPLMSPSRAHRSLILSATPQPPCPALSQCAPHALWSPAPRQGFLGKDLAAPLLPALEEAGLAAAS